MAAPSRRQPPEEPKLDPTESALPAEFHVAIIAASFPEIQQTIDLLHLVPRGPLFTAEGGGLRVTVAVGGMGPTNAAAALIRLLDVAKADMVVSAGFAGALDPKFAAGDVFEPRWIVNTRGDVARLTTESGVPDMLFGVAGQKQGQTLLSVEKVIATASQKRSLYENYPAAAVDMEGFHLAKLASQLGLRFRALRVISDDAHGDLPPEVEGWLNNDGTPNKKQALRDLARRPWRLPAAIRLARDSEKAAEVLAERVKDLLRSVAPAQHPKWQALE